MKTRTSTRPTPTLTHSPSNTMTPQSSPEEPAVLTDPKGAACLPKFRPRTLYDLAGVHAEVFVRHLAGDASVCLTITEEEAICDALHAAGMHGRSLLKTYQYRWHRPEVANKTDEDDDDDDCLPSCDKAGPSFERALPKLLRKGCKFCLFRFPDVAVDPSDRCILCLGELAQQFVVRRKNAHPFTDKDHAVVAACRTRLRVQEGDSPLAIYSAYTHQIETLLSRSKEMASMAALAPKMSIALGHLYAATRHTPTPVAGTPAAGPN